MRFGLIEIPLPQAAFRLFPGPPAADDCPALFDDHRDRIGRKAALADPSYDVVEAGYESSEMDLNV